jgi:predicted RND superfamily exporter protein
MIARMGKLMALSLLTTLAASVVFQPALPASVAKK